MAFLKPASLGIVAGTGTFPGTTCIMAANTSVPTPATTADNGFLISVLRVMVSRTLMGFQIYRLTMNPGCHLSARAEILTTSNYSLMSIGTPVQHYFIPPAF